MTADQAMKESRGYSRWVYGLRWLTSSVVVLILLVCVSTAWSGSPSEPALSSDHLYRVLYVNSYHPGNAWSDQVFSGIRETLNRAFGQQVDLSVEYLDGKRFSSALTLKLGDLILSTWTEKYADCCIDLLLVTDQDAYNMMHRARPMIFPGVPMVFAGVEDPGEVDPLTTGILASTDINVNIKTILQICPHVKQIWIITDNSSTGLINRKRAVELVSKYADRARLEIFDKGNGVDPDELISRCEKLDEDDAIFFLDYYTSPSGAVNSLDFVRKLTAATRAPVFCHDDLYLPCGVLGGVMNSGLLQGQQMAEIGIGILKSDSIGEMKLQKELALPMFDYGRLKENGVPLSLLPEGSIVLNKPEDFWNIYGIYILSGFVAILVEGYLIIWLFLLLRRQKKQKIEAALAAERFKTFFKMAPMAMAYSSRDGRVLDLNSLFTTVTGYTTEDISTTDDWFVRAYPDPEYRRRSIEAWRRRTQNDNPLVPREYQVMCKDGQVRSLEITAAVLGEGFLTCFNDISERKRAEQEREKLREQLTQAQKMESVGRLAGGVAHDFNNMLSVILGHTEMALDHVDPRHHLFNNLKEIQRAAEHSADLTRQLLAFARKQTATPVVLDLNETVEGLLNMLRRLIGESIQLTWQPGKDLNRIKIDPSQIGQILTNLCVNARDAIGDTGQVHIETRKINIDQAYCASHEGAIPGEYVQLTVSDNGCGMDEDTLSQLFEPFFTTKPVGKGTGLGLATVYGIVKQNEGFIEATSLPTKGTVFNIYLPVFISMTSPQPQVEVHTPVTPGNETIMLVEDEPMILDITTTMLKNQGYTVLSATCPSEAIRLAETYAAPIHLLITDVIMPELNGSDLASYLVERYPNLRCLFMSGYTSDVIAHHGVLDEGVHFIQKPFVMKDLAAKVREILDHGQELDKP